MHFYTYVSIYILFWIHTECLAVNIVKMIFIVMAFFYPVNYNYFYYFLITWFYEYSELQLFN